MSISRPEPLPALAQLLNERRRIEGGEGHSSFLRGLDGQKPRSIGSRQCVTHTMHEREQHGKQKHRNLRSLITSARHAWCAEVQQSLAMPDTQRSQNRSDLDKQAGRLRRKLKNSKVLRTCAVRKLQQAKKELVAPLRQRLRNIDPDLSGVGEEGRWRMLEQSVQYPSDALKHLLCLMLRALTSPEYELTPRLEEAGNYVCHFRKLVQRKHILEWLLELAKRELDAAWPIEEEREEYIATHPRVERNVAQRMCEAAEQPLECNVIEESSEIPSYLRETLRVFKAADAKLSSLRSDLEDELGTYLHYHGQLKSVEDTTEHNVGRVA